MMNRSRRMLIVVAAATLPLVVLALVLGLEGVSVGRAAQANRPDGSNFGPIVSRSIRNDTSLPLRDLAARAPANEGRMSTIREMLPLQDPKLSASAGILSAEDLSGIVQDWLGPNVMPPPIANFEGLGNVDGVLPPDTEGDVGHDPVSGTKYYMQWNNVSFGIWDVTNPLAPVVLVGATNGNALFSGFGGPCETTNDGDPIVLYDPLANRWMASQFALPNFPNAPFYECVAVSQTADPTGAWYRYQFQWPVNKMNDYPKFGVWPDGYYMSANQYAAGALTYAGVGVAALERSQMLAGNPAQIIFFDLAAVNPNYFSLMPSDLDGPAPPTGAPNPFINWEDGSFFPPNDAVRVWDFSVDWVTPANSTFGLSGNPNVTIPTLNVDPNMCNFARNCIPQPGGTPVDAISYRMMYRAQYRNFGGYQTIVSNHTVDENSSDHAGVHWFELRDSGGGWTMHQEGVYAPDSDHRWMGSIAMDSAGDIALGYSVSSASTFPSIRYSGRVPSDTLGTLPQGEATLIAGSGYQTHSASRWGDYSMMGVDPEDDCTFWYTQEYYAVVGSAPWQTRIGSFKFPGCGAPGDATIELTKTVGTDPAICAPTDVITVTAGTDVTYCYEVTNTGIVTLTQHDLVDSELGTLLDDFPFSLSPGASVFLTQTANLTTTTVNTAIWTAVNPSDFAFDADSATVNVPLPAIAVNPASLASYQGVNMVVSRTLTISSTGQAALDWSIDEALPLQSTARPDPGGDPARVIPDAIPSDPAATAGPLVDVIQDGSFEMGTPNPFWTEASTNFGTPLCTAAACGTGTGTGPRTGSWWAWFGGIGTYEEGSVSQDVVISPGPASLSFYLEQIVCDSPSDYLEVNVDGTQVFVSDGSSPLCGNLGYTMQSVDLSAFADGGTHTIEFHSEIFAANGGGSNFFVDDVVLDVAEPCDVLGDIPWASVSPAAGTTPAGTATDVSVVFDATGVAPGSYSSNLCVNSNDPDHPLVVVPLSMDVSAGSVDLEPEVQSMSGDPGSVIVFNFTVENTGVMTDTYDMSLFGYSWASTLSTASVGPLAPGETGMVTLSVGIPADASNGAMDDVTVTASSTQDASVSDSVTATSTAEVSPGYLPVIFSD